MESLHSKYSLLAKGNGHSCTVTGHPAKVTPRFQAAGHGIPNRIRSLCATAVLLVIASPSAEAVNLYLRAGSEFCINGGSSSQTLQLRSGTNQAGLSFSAKSNTFSFYSPALTNTVSIGSNRRMGGAFGVQNNGTASFQFQVSETIYDYDPITGSTTKVAESPTSSWSSSIGINGQTGRVSLPQKKIGNAVTIPAGHMLKVDITVTVSIDSGINGALIYNASAGNGKSVVVFPNGGSWPFATPASLPDATITAPSAVAENSTGNFASVLDAGAGAFYSWTITNGTITAGQSTRQITWTAGSLGEVGLGVSIVNGCFSSTGALAIIVDLRTNQTLAFDPISAQTYGDPPVTLNATASSGLPVTFSVVSGPATLLGNTLTLVGSGNVVVNANQAGDATWNPIVAQQSFTVNPRPLTVSGITATSKVYDGTTTAMINTDAASLSGVLAGESVILDTTFAAGDFADPKAGVAKTVLISGLDLNGTSAANYTLIQPTATASISAAALSVSGLTVNNKVYDGTTDATLDLSNASLMGAIPGDNVTLNTGSMTATFSDKDVGNRKTVSVILAITGTDAGNYTLPAMTTDLANITRASLIITANNASKVYGQTLTFAGTEFTVSGLFAGDAVSIVTLTSAGAAAAASAGSYNIVPSNATGTALDNYNITYNNGTLMVTPVSPPVLSILSQGTDSVSVILSGGISGQAYVFQFSTNLVNWTDAGTETADSNGVATFVDMSVRDNSCRIYRATAP